MPQLDPAHFASQLFWLAVTFGILYLVMARVVLPKIGTVLEERRDRIANDLDQAAMLRQKADEAVAVYEQALAEARGRAQAMAKDMRDKLAADAEDKRHKLDEQLNQRMAEADSSIATARDEAMGNVRTIAVDAAGAIVERLLGEAPGADETQAAVDSALAR